MLYSIIQKDLTRCYVCGTCNNIHIHHCYEGVANRKQSDKYHCIVALCGKHHNLSNEGVHFNKVLDLKLKQECQKAFKEKYPDIDFMDVFHRNYLDL